MSIIKSEDLETSPPDFLVDGIIPLTGIGFLWGPSRFGKSLLVNGELALAIANGTEFFGRETAPGKVIVCLGEGLYDAGVRKTARLAREQSDRAAVARERAGRYGDDQAKQWLDTLPAYTDDNLQFMTEPFILPMANGGEPTQSMVQAIDSMRQVKDLQMVILDSFSDFTPSLSISNDASANRSVAGMKLLARELDCVVLAVAHPTQKGGKMLGAGRLFNAADFVIQVQPEDSYGRDAPRGATVVCEKNKYGKPFEPFGYHIESCAWNEPLLDDDDLPTGETMLVESATVRPANPEHNSLRTSANIEPVTRQRKPLPDLIDMNAKPRKRNGIRPRGNRG